MKEPLFGPAMTGPIDDPRFLRLDPREVTAALFDEKTRVRLQRLAQELRFSPIELIREGTLRYLDTIEHTGDWPSPDVSPK